MFKVGTRVYYFSEEFNERGLLKVYVRSGVIVKINEMSGNMAVLESGSDRPCYRAFETTDLNKYFFLNYKSMAYRYVA